MSRFFDFGHRAACSLLVTTAAAAATIPPPARAEGPSAPATAPQTDRHPDLKRLSTTEDIWIDAVRKEVVVGGAIALDRGMIEVFACPKHTKEHEAIVATAASARLMHAALLAIGLEPGRPVLMPGVPAYDGADGQLDAAATRVSTAPGCGPA